MLVSANEMTYNEPILLPDTSLKISEVSDPSLINIEQNEGESFLILKPNPANDYVIAEWDLPASFEDAWIYVSDVDGRFIEKIRLYSSKNQKVLSTSNWKSGTYIFNLVASGIVYDSSKLNIIK